MFTQECKPSKSLSFQSKTKTEINLFLVLDQETTITVVDGVKKTIKFLVRSLKNWNISYID